MASVRRVTYLKARLKDKPGSLLNLMQGLKRKKLGLSGLWGYSTRGGRAELYVVAGNTAKVRAQFRSAQAFATEGKGFWVTGKNQIGALNRCLEALAKARVSIIAIDAIAVAGRFGSFIWVKPNNVAKAAKVLRAQ